MKKEMIAALFAQFEQACYIYNGIECWSARELQPILDYARWENFTNAIDKAKKSCENAGEQIPHHFRGITKMIELPKGEKGTAVNAGEEVNHHFVDINKMVELVRGAKK